MSEESNDHTSPCITQRSAPDHHSQPKKSKFSPKDHTAQNAMPSIPQLMNLNYRKSPNPGTLAFSQPYRKPQSCTWKRQSPGISFPLRAVSRTPIDHSSTKEGSRQGAGRAKDSDTSLQLSEEGDRCRTATTTP